MVWEEFICDSRYASVSISSFDRGIVELESKRHKNGMKEREKRKSEKRESEKRERAKERGKKC